MKYLILANQKKPTWKKDAFTLLLATRTDSLETLDGHYWTQRSCNTKATDITPKKANPKVEYVLYTAKTKQDLIKQVEIDFPAINVEKLDFSKKTGVSKARIPLKKESAALDFTEPVLVTKPTSTPVQDGNTVEIFTDGSATPGKPFCGWAFVAYQDKEEIHYENKVHLVGSNAKRAVHLAEFLAVLHALDYVLQHKFSSALICYDNMDVFNVAVCENSSDIEMFCKYTQYMKEKWQQMERLGISLKMKHVKAHSGIVGNERADWLAKDAVVIAEKYF